jgi:hypothetical protein
VVEPFPPPKAMDEQHHPAAEAREALASEKARTAAMRKAFNVSINSLEMRAKFPACSICRRMRSAGSAPTRSSAFSSYWWCLRGGAGAELPPELEPQDAEDGEHDQRSDDKEGEVFHIGSASGAFVTNKRPPPILPNSARCCRCSNKGKKPPARIAPSGAVGVRRDRVSAACGPGSPAPL